MGEIIAGLLSYLGLTRETVVPLLIFGAIGYILISSKIQEVKEDLRIKIDNIIRNIIAIKGHLVTNLNMKAELFVAMSPVILTEKGAKLLKRSDFDKIYTGNKGWFIEKIKRRNPEKLSEIDEISGEIMESLRDHEWLKDFKEIAFQNGITVDLLLRVCAIYLREEVAKEILK